MAVFVAALCPDRNFFTMGHTNLFPSPKETMTPYRTLPICFAGCPAIRHLFISALAQANIGPISTFQILMNF
jgi:hypothetical protein